MEKHIVCFSGGHSSGLVAIELTRKYGKENVILLNHDINPTKENPDIKRFKREVAAYLGIPITYANYGGITDPDLIPDQFDIAMLKKGFKNPGTGDALCTYHLKTLPFINYLGAQFPLKDCFIYYGFDDDEQSRIERRRFILGQMGYEADFPLAFWPSTIENTEEVGIPRPLSYAVYKHGNCEGCLKGGVQHWYVTYCHRYDIYTKGKTTERALGYSILSDRSGGARRPHFLDEIEPIFDKMKADGVPQNEHFPAGKFQVLLKKYKLELIEERKPCECSID